jgi:hypothetical protein
MRLSSSRATALTHRPQQDFPLWDKAGTRPSLDLQFADRKDLVDATTGSNLVDFTRASSGTYVGSDGLIKTATTNLLPRSEEFDNAASWTASSLTITPNDAIAPDGNQTADKWQNTSTTGIIAQSIAKAASATTYTASVWIKSTDATGFSLTIDDGVTVNRGRCVFNLTTGVLSFSLNDGDFTNTSGTITPYPSSWYRITVTTTTNTQTTVRFRAFFSGNGGIAYIWGAQLEQSSTVGEYVKTTSTINSAPRFDHNPTTGESLGLLVEESRTNLLLQSEDLSTTWNTINATVTTNQIASPNGTVTADLMSDDGSTPARVRQQVTVVAGQTYTASIYLKAGSQDSVFWREDNEDSFAVGVNLTTGQITSGTGTIDPVGDGWYRVSFSGSVSSTGFWPEVRLSSAGTVYVWGAQLEAGSFPTSYIPTTDSTVTRAADLASISGSNFSSWYRQDEGTVYSEHMWMTTSDYGTVWGLDDNTGNNEARLIGWNSATDRAPAITVGGTAQIQWTNNSYSANTLYRYGIAYKQNDVASSRNGALPLTDGIVSLPSVTRLAIGSTRSTAFELNGTIRRLTYWPSRLPNDTLQTITL